VVNGIWPLFSTLVDFVAICISILLWLVRPQDWVSGLAGMSFMTYSMIIAILGLYQRPGSITRRHFTQSPADYLVIVYLTWTIWTTGGWIDMTKAMIPFASFYFVAALAINSPQRLNTFLSCWVAGLSITMFFALSSVYGFEIVGGTADLTERFLERLALNTWIYNNPNSLGHGVVALIPMAYIWLVWRRGVGARLLGMIIIAGAAQVTYMTQSKGAYLSGAAAVTISLLFRKSRIVQIFMIVCMLTVGLGALKLLPRMENLDTKEAGIAGRLLIWQMAHNAMANTFTGEGWKKFQAWIETDDYGLIHKATHGSYVNVGADLGYIGLMLFVGILYANSRTLIQARVDPAQEDLERCQRLLLSLTTSFAFSAWMIDRAYHTDYFILAGTVSAFHRLMTLRQFQALNPSDERNYTPEIKSIQELTGLSIILPKMIVAETGLLMSANCSSNTQSDMSVRTVSEQFNFRGAQRIANNENEAGSNYGLRWTHLQGIDAFWIVLLLLSVDRVWQYLMTSFISI
jgi:hypothetical protein